MPVFALGIATSDGAARTVYHGDAARRYRDAGVHAGGQRGDGEGEAARGSCASGAAVASW